MAPHFPPVKWAQRAEYIFLTIDVQDARDVKIDIQESGSVLHFSCNAPATAASSSSSATTNGGDNALVAFAFTLSLFRPISAEESQHVVRPRHIELKLKKRLSSGETVGTNDDDEEEELNRQWPRLTATKQKLPQLQVDWAKWKDEDAEDGDDADLDNFGLGGESGINYEDMMRQFMVKEGQTDAEQYAGVENQGVIPSFGSAAGQQPISGDLEEEDEDMPPLEEDV